jgi:hypothetical protein
MKRADRLRVVLAQLDALRAEVEDLIAESDRLPRRRKRAVAQPTQEPTQEQVDAARRGLRRAGIAA